mgnify:CR=1 FL=1
MAHIWQTATCELNGNLVNYEVKKSVARKKKKCVSWQLSLLEHIFDPNFEKTIILNFNEQPTYLPEVSDIILYLVKHMHVCGNFGQKSKFSATI